MVALPGVVIQSKIYESSTSLVYRGIREKDGRSIVIKLLKQEYPSPQELTRYRQEYQITRSLNLEGVVKAYSQQDYQRTLVILLEDFGGESLEHWMRQRSEGFCPMPLSSFLRLAIELTEILGRIHSANVIHKDINPGNIVLNPDTSVVKIIDFGIATQFNRTNPTFKGPHGIEGTLAYLSPEQTGRMNRMLDYRTDFYSLGVTFYELLTGQLPFPTTDILELVHCHIAKQPVPPHERNAAIPKTVSDIILKLMAKNAEDRYQSAWGITADLKYCARQLTATGQIDGIQLGLQDISDQFQIPQKLYGREAEIAALLQAFERVAGGSNATGREREGDMEGGNIPASPCPRVLASSEMMLVSGYAGIGKSALVQELYKPITAKRGYFVSGKFDQLQRNTPYSAIVAALQKLVQQLLGEPDERVQEWRSHLLTALGSNGQLIIDVIPEVELIIGKQPPLPEVGSTEAQNRFNLVFQKFIRACCSAEHPLVIFLDDLQWVDSATLKLIELILSDRVMQSLLLIGAYRDNEVTQAHPLVLTLEKLKQENVAINQITLAPLELEAVTQLIAETLHMSVELNAPLAELVWRKANGNPYFTNEFLKTLYTENLIIFNIHQRCWQWDITQIKAKNITDNVVELIIGKLKRFPEQTQQVLCLAACVGAEFDLATLAVICEQSAVEIFAELTTAMQSELVIAASELDENLLIQNYKFSHDRVQQAAYALIDESRKQGVHLQIGCNLLEKTLPEQLSERLFEIVDHLNHGIELITNQAERDEIAKLNLMAAQKAKGAIAYSVAKEYLATAREWLAVSSWQTNYELTLELCTETTEVAYLCGEYEQVEYWVAIVLQEAKTVLDTVKVYDVNIQTDMAQGQPLKAIDTALQVLQQLGISFPKNLDRSEIQHELDVIVSLIGEKPIGDLIHLPKMIEPNKLAAMQILSSITVAAYIAAPGLVPILVSKQVNLSIQYGNALVSPVAYASFGSVLCVMLGNIQSGYEFGQLALRLLSHSKTHPLRARTLYIANTYVFQWKEPIRETSKLLLEAYQSGLETGDLESAGYCANSYCYQSFFAGKELVEVEREMKMYSEVMRQIKQIATLNWIQMRRQTVLNLMGCSDNPTLLIGESFNEKKKLSHQEMQASISFQVHINKLFLCYLFSEYAEAVNNSTIVESYSVEERGTLLVPFYYFYNALARLATYPESNAQVQEEILQKVAINQEKLKQWAQYAPMNYLHKYHLVKAEKSRVLGQLLEAEKFYEQAIQGARENEYIQEEALAYELAAKHYLARGLEKFAQLYMKEAHYCYERWGAAAKVKDLETRYPQFFPQSPSPASIPIHTAAETTSNTPQVAFDLATVMKASQAIAREIELEQLLRSLMQILIENAGAQTGSLLLENAGEWFIEAACELSDGESVCTTQVLQSIPIANRLPESIIQYVIRTHESVILNDATREGNFINDPYIQRSQTRSLFCLPLLNQSKLVGVLYLENQLVMGAFTSDGFSVRASVPDALGDVTRTQVLNLLSTQAAIAIENARLYSKLRASESRMAQFLEAVPVGITVVDAAGRPYYMNQRAIELLGKGPIPSATIDQLAETYQGYVVGTNQKYPTEKLTLFQALKGERTRTDDSEIHRDSTIIPIEAWGTPVFDEQGKVAYAIAAFQDITERKQTEQLLANYNRTLEQQVAERTAALQQSETELRDVFNELRLREQELRLVTDALPVCISYVDANQRYRFVNRTYENWFNLSREQILGKHICEILGEKAYQVVEPYINQVFEGQTMALEVEMPLPSGKKYIKATLIPDFDSNAQVKGFYALNTDISDYKRTEAALQASEAELRALFAAVPDPLFVLTAEGRVIEAVEVGAGQLYKPLEEQVGKTLHEIFSQEQADEFLAYIHQVLNTQQVLTVEYSLLIAGQTTWFSARLAPIGPDQVLWLARDISEQRDAALRELKRAEEASILEERNRMAREIHDTLAQAFTGILVHMGTVSRLVATNPEAIQTHINTVRELARSGLAEARRSVAALRPQLLEEGSLGAALEQFVSRMKSSTETHLVCEIIGTPYALSPETENNLLRIGQEAFTNAIKYANANEIRIELVYEPTSCSLQVRDNGRGFEMNTAILKQGFGLLGMTERAEYIGAQLSIQSQLGQGTEVVVSVHREEAT